MVVVAVIHMQSMEAARKGRPLPIPYVAGVRGGRLGLLILSLPKRV